MLKKLLLLFVMPIFVVGCGDDSSTGSSIEPLVGSAQTSKYHRVGGCEWLHLIDYEDKVWFHEEEFAQDLHFYPCRVCVPPLAPYIPPLPAPSGVPFSEPATVDYVVDGDTINVVFSDGSEERVRLIGVNTPEVGDCYYQEAALFTTALVSGQPVTLEYEGDDTAYDKFGRLLAYVYIGGTSVNEELVANGYGHAYTLFPFREMHNYLAIEEAAEFGGTGLWSACLAPLP